MIPRARMTARITVEPAARRTVTARDPIQKWTAWWLLLVVGGVISGPPDTRLVQTEQGPVVGRRDAKKGIYSFLNIPYATVPTGVDKFKGPLPPPNWTEPYDVADKIIACTQSLPVPFFPGGKLPKGVSMEENCLVVNIHVPETTTTNLSVLVTIHGGAYQSMYGETYQFKDLVRTKRVITITFNYRVGVIGFLCLGTQNIPGNAGMKDQVALLRWVNKNIVHFGGNPDDVTLLGCSAGGGAVDFLTLSPMAAGLFNKAIPESGVVLGCTGTQIDPIENAKFYARHLNFTNVDDLRALEEFYRRAPYEFLLSRLDVILDRNDSLPLFTPCVERDTGTGEERFIDDTPLNYLKNDTYNKVPLLFGFTNMEGITAFTFHSFDIFKARMNGKFANFLPAELTFESEAQKDAVAATVKEFYFGTEPISEKTALNFVNFFTDVMFTYPMHKVASMKASHGDTIYLYKYSYVDENTPFVPFTKARGAKHCEQLFSVEDDVKIFDVEGEPPKPDHTAAFREHRENLREMWLNFITTSNPTPQGSLMPSWVPMKRDVSPYMSLDTTIQLQESHPFAARARLWDAIYENHYRPPIPPAV